METREFNFDGLVGPTHNYAGLSHGNIASESNKAATSNPRQAALQGLEKAADLARRGFPQAVLPPHERPSITALQSWGFTGSNDARILEKAARESPALLRAASSASAMWTANACTMAPSSDTADGRAHFTPANLSGNLHRSIEAGFTETLLKAIFKDPDHFQVHPPLAGGEAMADEGAANHTRLSCRPSGKGLHLFVYGRSALDSTIAAPSRFPARQTLESWQAIARLHALESEQTLFLQQSPKAIDAGVFHNDVISVGSGRAFLYHEEAFAKEQAIDNLKRSFEHLSGEPLQLIPVSASQVSLKESVKTYLFNSQLLQKPDQSFLLVMPAECQESPVVKALCSAWLDDPACPISELLSFDLKESMRNGGGPACLRQRILLNEAEEAALAGRLILDDALYNDLLKWINRHYRTELHPGDLADPLLLEESRQALNELTRILELPPIYPFQQ
ncbi:N-succinylarginine dihydrolase [Puniceicoccales bacterium CK1056]|uniref:N-succinylarginine dihydrolase n=1 Tax=Oceanipulchritudo coccoides TaxID=2706888 RepID=A0A6B2M2L1_9BACT|nr:N-succinylarginine dihydrolase [Oceanipulchritudo coccoides]NDV62562.1 N-succinylarginine dihydrolase [Oceanipulchritudo coccoides]